MMYVPLLKWKQGEQNALKNLSDGVKCKISPILELVKIPKRKYPPSTKEYIEENINSILSSWGVEQVYIDLYDFDEDACLDDGTHFMSYLFDRLVANDVNAIPVVSSTRSNLFKSSIKNICNKYKTGICIRLQEEDFGDSQAIIKKIMNDNNVRFSDTSLVLDFKEIHQDKINLNILAIKTLIEQINKLGMFYRVIFCGTGFPTSLSHIKRNTVGKIPRNEWVLWEKLYNNSSALPILPEYGDYNITNPDMIEFDPVRMHIGGKIKYTYENDILIFKGSSFRRDGSHQMHQIASRVVKSSCFMGKDFSWGDEYIYNCSKETVTCGNPTTWVTVGVNHHITYVIKQLSTMSAI